MPECPGEGAGVKIHEFVEEAGRGLLGAPEHERGEGGDERQRNEEACQQGIRDGKAHIGEELAGDAFGEHQGEEHADGS